MSSYELKKIVRNRPKNQCASHPAFSCAMRREFKINSWRILAFTGPIASEVEKTELLVQVEDRREKKAAPPPEQTFLANALLIEHEQSGWVLSFNAKDALKQSMDDDNKPVKVALANKWQADRVEVLQDIKKMNYDWTYTTSYAGKWSNPKNPEARMTVQDSEEQLNVELLTDRTIPLVGYHEAPLFVSELDDAGASELTVRLRVTDRASLFTTRPLGLAVLLASPSRRHPLVVLAS